MQIIVASYKPTSDDYCRGCHMGTYRSDFIIQRWSGYTNSENKAIMQLAAKHITEIDLKPLDVNEDGYEHTIYISDPNIQTINDEFVTSSEESRIINMIWSIVKQEKQRILDS